MTYINNSNSVNNSIINSKEFMNSMHKYNLDQKSIVDKLIEPQGIYEGKSSEFVDILFNKIINKKRKAPNKLIYAISDLTNKDSSIRDYLKSPPLSKAEDESIYLLLDETIKDFTRPFTDYYNLLQGETQKFNFLRKFIIYTNKLGKPPEEKLEDYIARTII